MAKLEHYYDGLPVEAKRRYRDKLELISGVDPLCINAKSGYDPAALPPVDAGDLVSYLVLQTSYITAKQFKAHKSMDAYNQFVSGWVKEVQTWNISGKCVVIGKVSAAGPYGMP